MSTTRTIVSAMRIASKKRPSASAKITIKTTEYEYSLHWKVQSVVLLVLTNKTLDLGPSGIIPLDVPIEKIWPIVSDRSFRSGTNSFLKQVKERISAFAPGEKVKHIANVGTDYKPSLTVSALISKLIGDITRE